MWFKLFWLNIWKHELYIVWKLKFDLNKFPLFIAEIWKCFGVSYRESMIFTLPILQKKLKRYALFIPSVFFFIYYKNCIYVCVNQMNRMSHLLYHRYVQFAEVQDVLNVAIATYTGTVAKSIRLLIGRVDINHCVKP